MEGSVYNLSRKCVGIWLRVKRDCNGRRLDEVSCNELALICKTVCEGPDSEQERQFDQGSFERLYL